MFFFPLQIRLLLLSPRVFVAPPPFLLLSASKRCYPIVSFAYRTFDVWPHRRCHVGCFPPLPLSPAPLLRLLPCCVSEGEGRWGGGAYLAAAISSFICCIIAAFPAAVFAAVIARCDRGGDLPPLRQLPGSAAVVVAAVAAAVAAATAPSSHCECRLTKLISFVFFCIYFAGFT